MSTTFNINNDEIYSAINVEFLDNEGKTKYGYGCFTNKINDLDYISESLYYYRDDMIKINCLDQAWYKTNNNKNGVVVDPWNGGG
jgi:hypothetical protein